MKETIAKIKNSSFIKNLKSILSSKYFPFVTALLFLLCYYLGWDMVLVYYVAFTGIAILLLLDDVTPVITLLIFISVLVSNQNSPSTIMENSDFYLKAGNIAQIVVLMSLFFLTGVYRVVMCGIRKKFVITPVFYGLCAFAAVMILNGVFSEDYKADNLLYGSIMAACFLFIFAGIKDNIVFDKSGFERVALSFCALSLLLAIELIIKYFTVDDLIVNGEIMRGKLTFGWGMWNTMGMMLVLCVPSVIYLAYKAKYGFVYTLYSILLFVACFMSCSRQAIITVAIIYPICLIILLFKKENRIANLCVIGCALIAGAILLAVSWNTVVKYFIELFKNLFTDGELNGNGRIGLWKEAINYFKSAPLFGVGFYVDFKGDPGFSGLGFVPLMCHNTFFQLLSACGIVGLVAYCFHRVQTVISFCRNITIDRAFIGLTILGLLITSLFDNHIFYIFPTIIYSCLIALLVRSEKKPETQTLQSQKLPS